MERGIEPYVATFHKDLDKKEWRAEWKKATNQSHPVLIIATARMLFIPRSDLGIILIDKENENGWKTISRPFIDLRFFAETLAKRKEIKTILGDSFLRIETLFRVKQKEIGEFERIEWRLPTNIETKIVDLRETGKYEKEFRVVSACSYLRRAKAFHRSSCATIAAIK